MANLIEGIDVSRFQGAINWAQVAAAGVKWAAVKATEGNGYTDNFYRANVTGARANGILVMPYHFLSHDIDAKSQAEHFLKVIDRAHNPDLLLPALDVEPDPSSSHALFNKAGAYGTIWPGDHMVRLVDDFQTYMHAGLGAYITIYTYPYWWEHYQGDTHNYAQACPLWIASYSNPPRPDYLPKEPVSFGGWPYWTFHQWTTSGGVPGCPHVDQDNFKGSLGDLKKFANY
jgi:GH25 family lysozyme M1 (1,4-beta-N-acetylmuramidase)